MNDDDLVRPTIAKLRVIAATAKEPICSTVLDAADAIERLQAELAASVLARDTWADDCCAVAREKSQIEAELAAANEEIALLRGDDTGADARATYWHARCHALERDRARIEGDQ